MLFLIQHPVIEDKMKQKILRLLLILIIPVNVYAAAESISEKILIGTITRVDSEHGTVLITSTAAITRKEQKLFTAGDGKEITLRVLGINGTDILCDASDADINLLKEGMTVYAHTAVNADDTSSSGDKGNDESLNYKKDPGSAEHDRRIAPRLTAGITYKTDNFWRGSDFYGEESGVSSVYASASVRSFYVQAMYERPGFAFSGNGPDHYDAFGLTAVYSIVSGMPFTPFFRYDLKYLPEAARAGTSGFMTGTMGAYSNTSLLRLGISCSMDYYTDSLHGDRETFSDYLVRLSLNAYSTSFVPANTFITLYIYADYYNNIFADSKATPEDESRKGISDITGQVSLNIHITDELSVSGEFSLAYMPDSDWNRVTKYRAWCGFGIYMNY